MWAIFSVKLGELTEEYMQYQGGETEALPFFFYTRHKLDSLCFV